MDEKKKVIFVERGKTLKIKCLEDVEIRKGYFLIKDERGVTARADEIVAGNVLYTADEAKIKFSKDGLEYMVYLAISECVKNEKWPMAGAALGSFGTVNYALAKDLASLINSELGFDEFRGLTSSTVGKICRSLGFRYTRTAKGYAVVLEKQDLQAAGAKFNLLQAE